MANWDINTEGSRLLPALDAVKAAIVKCLNSRLGITAIILNFLFLQVLCYIAEKNFSFSCGTL